MRLQTPFHFHNNIKKNLKSIFPSSLMEWGQSFKFYLISLSPHLLATLHMPYSVSQVGLVGIVLSKIALSWFASLLEKSSPLLYMMHSLKTSVFNIWWSWFWKDCEHTNLKPMTMISSCINLCYEISTTNIQHKLEWRKWHQTILLRLTKSHERSHAHNAKNECSS